ncbi:MAG: HAD-IB family phosphatase [Oscillospiraceae bacterium]
MRYIVFSDFDGTISYNNTFAEVLRKFSVGADPEVERSVMNGTTTLSEGVRHYIEHIPSTCHDAIIELSKTIELRPGFRELLELLKENDIPFVVISGGLKIISETALRDYMPLIYGLHALEVSTDGEFFGLTAQYDDGNEILAKRLVLKEYDCDRVVCIGDGNTDFEIIKDADVIFACDELADHLQKQNMSFHRFTDFFDVAENIKKLKITNK